MSIGRLAIGRLTVLLLLSAPPLVGQEPEPQVLVGLRLGLASAVQAPGHFDSVWGDSLSFAGLELESRFRRTFVLLSLDWTETLDGDLVVEVPRTFEPGFDAVEVNPRFAANIAHLSLGWSPGSRSGWRPFVGGGISAVQWEDKNDLRALEDSELGPHLLAGVTTDRGRWSLATTLRYALFSDMKLDTSGKLTEFERGDLALLSLELSARYRVWSADDRAFAPAGTGRGRFVAYAIGAWFHPTYSHSRLAADWILRSDQDDGPGYGLGIGFRLGGPFSIALEGVVAELDTSSTQTVRTPSGTTTVRAAGRLDVDALTLALEVDLWRGERVRLFGGPLVAHLSYEGSESGDYDIGIDRDGTNLGLELGAEIRLAGGGWTLTPSLEHLSVLLIDGFESGFELDPLVLTLGVGYRFGGAS